MKDFYGNIENDKIGFWAISSLLKTRMLVVSQVVVTIQMRKSNKLMLILILINQLLLNKLMMNLMKTILLKLLNPIQTMKHQRNTSSQILMMYWMKTITRICVVIKGVLSNLLMPENDANKQTNRIQ